MQPPGKSSNGCGISSNAFILTLYIPLIGAVTTASGRLFPKTHIEGLSLEKTGGWLYISRGMAQGGMLTFRYLSRPELSVITLLAE